MPTDKEVFEEEAFRALKEVREDATILLAILKCAESLLKKGQVQKAFRALEIVEQDRDDLSDILGTIEKYVTCCSLCGGHNRGNTCCPEYVDLTGEEFDVFQ